MRDVVAAARRWIGTPYHPQADVCGAGVDCGMLIVRVLVDSGRAPPIDPRPYADDWLLHRGDEIYLDLLRDLGCVESAAPAPGDIVVFRYGRCFAHGAIISRTDPMTIIHAFSLAGTTLEEPLARNPILGDPARPRRYFRAAGMSCLAMSGQR